MTSGGTISEPTLAVDEKRHRVQRRIETLCVAIGITTLLGFTIRTYGLSNDESVYVRNNRHAAEWFHDTWRLGPSLALTTERLAQGWPYARVESRNLPLPGIVSMVGRFVAGRFDSFPAAFRWGHVFVFAITSAVIFSWIREQYSRPAAAVALLALVGNPRLFAHANLVAVDTLVASFWVLASYSLVKSRPQWKWAVAFAVCAGIGFTAKPTFWFAFPVWLLWGLLHKPRELWRSAICVVTVMPLTALALLPMWWLDPFDGFFGYVHMLLSDTQGWTIGTYYLGEIYQAPGASPVPWHSVIVLTCVTTPVWMLVLLLIGAATAICEFGRPNAYGVMWLLCGLALPVVCMLPFTPAHDGVRLYRSAFYFAPMLIASGFDQVFRRVYRATGQTDTLGGQKPTRQKALRFSESITRWSVIALLSLWSVWSCYRIHPGELSYYNEFVGHLRGAAEPRPQSDSVLDYDRPRHEIAYWWESITASELTAMQSHLPIGAKVWMYPRHDGLWLLQEQGVFRSDIEFVSVGRDADFLFLYGRFGTLLLGHPTASVFLQGDAIWETRIDDVRIAGLFRQEEIDRFRFSSPGLQNAR
jgi:hypothetical protein